MCEVGTEQVVIVELKKPGIVLGMKEKTQCQDYAIQLLKEGAIQPVHKGSMLLVGAAKSTLTKTASLRMGM